MKSNKRPELLETQNLQNNIPLTDLKIHDFQRGIAFS